MKVKWNEKYTTIAVYSIIVLFTTIIFYLIASEVNLFRIQLGKYLNVFQPIIIGFVFAYLFNFFLVLYEDKIIVRSNNKKIIKRKRGLGIMLTYLTVGFLFFLFLKFIFPQLLSSLAGLVNEIPDYISNISRKIVEFSDKLNINDEYNKVILERWNQFVAFTLDFVTNLIPKIGNFTRDILASIWNIVLGIIVSIYLLVDKERFLALSKKMTYGLLPEKRADRTVELVQRADHIFGRFLGGKVLDSVIIGILTLIILLLVRMPYANLVAFIIGVTNVIPFFGPFIGAIPSFFIILFESPTMAVWFLLIILIIQQIDGNIIGPKILGESLGISAFWILFSLLVAGKLFGFIGLVIGVPLFVFIYSIIKDNIELRLKKKGLPVATKEYYEK